MKANLLTLALTLGTVWPNMAQGTIDQLVNTIVDNNPQLTLEQNEADAVLRESMDENALSNPEVSITRVWGKQQEAGNKFQLDVSQSFDWPGLYRARSRVAQSQWEFAQLEIETSRLETALSTKQLLLDLVYARQQFDLQQELLNNYRQMVEAMDKSLAQGLVTILDKKKLDIEIYKLESSIAQTQSQIHDLEEEIGSLSPTVKLDLKSVVSYPIESLKSEEDYRQEAIASDPSLKKSRLNESTAALQAKSARQSKFPGFSVGYEYQNESGMTYNGFTMGVTLPFFENRKARGAALLRAESAKTESNAIEAAIALRTSQNVEKANLWRNQIEAYDKTIAGNEYLNLVKQGYEGGELSLLSYLEEIQYYRETTLEYMTAQYNYASTLASLNRYSILSPAQ